MILGGTWIKLQSGKELQFTCLHSCTWRISLWVLSIQVIQLIKVIVRQSFLLVFLDILFLNSFICIKNVTMNFQRQLLQFQLLFLR